MSGDVVPFLDLKAQHLPLRAELLEALGGVIDTCQFALGSEVAEFEREFARYCGAAHAVAVNSGTSALHLALLALGVGPGDEVITVPFTFVATVAAIRYTGATPVFVDIEPGSFTMAAERLEAAITGRTRAILPVHIYGQCADMDPILHIARKHGLTVVEDAAQAHGALYKGRPAGSMGDVGCFSFYPGKNLGACGEGGIAVTASADLAGAMREMRDWGQSRKYHHDRIGFNYRMEGFQGAVLRIKLRLLEEWTERRRSRASLYRQLLEGASVGIPAELPHSRHVYHLFAIRSAHRDRLQGALLEDRIQTGIHYPIPVHLQKAHRDLGHARGDFPVTERAADEVLSLPMFAELTDDQVRRVCASIREHDEG